ncbi:MAG: tRNA dihydrouridine synthase DusB [Planctomycetota bacterium]|nr:tRNA dihydrouridine synthase DusB [Planctomycetota bacterium]MEC8651524.1 tRNA dihydrouridine synthase DusB [Planctomycetota bacterium]
MRSEENAGVTVAQPGEISPLQIGDLVVDPPVVLAPMAGITNAPFRTLCREFSQDRCLYVSEMITARAFVEGHARTLQLASFGEDEKTRRSIQLYGTNPDTLAQATKVLAEEWGVHHIDMNFGCPVRKVTAAGGGSAIPVKPRLLQKIVRSVVKSAGDVPVTIKFRKGIDDDLLTFLDAGRIGEEEGARAVALHARTAAQLYSGKADWDAITELKQHVKTIPVLGNGDIFEPWDAMRMIRQTGCDGVVVGRGCLGRPWLFAELCAVLTGEEPPPPPDLGAVLDTMTTHARLLAAFFGEKHGLQQIRKFTGWYLKGFPGTKKKLPALHLVKTIEELEALLADLPRDLPYPLAGLRARRCKDGKTQTVSLPEGFLEARDEDLVIDDPEHVDGG